MAALCFALAAGPGCDSGEHRLQRSKRRALDYFATRVVEVDPGWASLFGYYHRRFGLEATGAAGQALHDVPEDQLRPEMARIVRRLEDASATVEVVEIARLDSTIDRITASALHCDRIPLPGNWLDILARTSEAGGYALTHAALAGQWTLENGCLGARELAPMQARQVALLEALVADRDALAEEFEAATDIWIEALAMLYYLGAGARVPAEWVDAVIVEQRRDGGWPRHPANARSDPHASALALWVLLENLQPEAPSIVWIPQR